MPKNQNQQTPGENRPLAARSRPQYHYFYGSTTDDTDDHLPQDEGNDHEHDSLIGEELVPTDHEDDENTPNSSERDLPHLLITNGNSTKPWFLRPQSTENHDHSMEGQRQQQQQRGVGGGRINCWSYGLGRMIAIIILAVGLSALLITFLPHTSETTTAGASYIPFQQIQRSEFGDPVDGFIDRSLFHPTLLTGGNPPRSFVFPFPTGAFWTNFVLPSSSSSSGGSNKISYPIVVYPYAYKWANSFLQLSYPGGHRHSDEHTIIDTFQPELTITTEETIANRYITKFDPLSVTLRFVATQTSKWETALVQGSPYATMKYLNATPVLKPLSTFKSVQCPGDDDENFSDLIDDENIEFHQRRLFGVCSIDDSNKGKTYLRGVQFILKTPEGVSYIMFSSEPMNLVYDALSKTKIASTAPFTGVLRIACIPAKDAADTSVDSSTGLRRLIYHAGVYPVGGQVSWEFSNAKPTPSEKSSRQQPIEKYATIHLSYATQSMTDINLRPTAPANSLLMLSLPHHAGLLPKSTLLDKKHFDLSYRCIKGPLTPVLGSTWSYDEALPTLDFDGPTNEIDSSVVQTILDQVEDDIATVLPSVTGEDIYGFGKQVARLANLVHISSRFQRSTSSNITTPDKASELLDKSSELLKGYLERFLSDQVVDGLVYDSNLGGIVSKHGLMDNSADFGNGRYNDHHFHYGYLLYASAVMGAIDQDFIKRFAPHIDTIFRDVAYGSNSDSRIATSNTIFFPLARHKSWFDGHSFATGLFPFATGKSQESSSEAVNCYYGAYLWSLVRHGSIGSDATDFARLLLATEIRGAKTYWHMLPPPYSSNSSIISKIYNPNFQGHYMVGNVGMLDVAANTWFGNDPLYVHMINVIPVTAVTAFLLDENYVKHEYPYLMNSHGDVEMAWRGYTTSVHAIIDPNAAWIEAQDLVSWELDSALSKSQVLYWISQRPGFTAPSKTGGNDTSTSPPINGTENNSTSSSNSPSPNDDASCESHSDCASNGLTGKCCPTAEGVSLGCC